ncbi:MAG: hypothetical protein JWR18_109 [Segetibacter sp.]|jgi:hypothetical protein|nr:hypothetical protein [Segetibacter sp.]
MKKLLVILFSLGMTLSVTAQPKIGGGFRGVSPRVHGGGGVRYVQPRVTIIAPYTPIYPYYGYGLGYGSRFGLSSRLGYGYSPFNDPFYNQRFADERPSQLDLQIDDIKNEYEYKIDTVKDDKNLSKDEKKQKVRDLKHQREDEIIEAKKKYYQAQDDKKDS